MRIPAALSVGCLERGLYPARFSACRGMAASGEGRPKFPWPEMAWSDPELPFDPNPIYLRVGPLFARPGRFIRMNRLGNRDRAAVRGPCYRPPHSGWGIHELLC